MVLGSRSVPLPVVAGAQSYGLALFHSSTSRRVMEYFALLR
jgi:hypothetical protein